MIKRFAFILTFLLFTAYQSSAKAGNTWTRDNSTKFSQTHKELLAGATPLTTDTLKIKTIAQNHMDVLDSKKKIKEVAKPKHQSKPEKVLTPSDSAALDKKAKRQRRPDGLERPPEIPRRGNN